MHDPTTARTRPPGRLIRWCLPRLPLVQYPPPPDAAPPQSAFGVVAAAFGWGILVGIVSGAAAGTVILPVLGTIYGAVIGPFIAIPPALAGTVAVAVVVRRQPLPLSPEGLAHDLARLFARIVTLLLAIVFVVATVIAVTGVDDTDPTRFAIVFTWALAAITAATAATIALLRRANRALTRRLALAHGWR